MARTKKFLASSNKTRSFYRPLKRTASQSAVPFANNVNFKITRTRKMPEQALDNKMYSHLRTEVIQKQSPIENERSNFSKFQAGPISNLTTTTPKYDNHPVISLDFEKVTELAPVQKQTPEPIIQTAQNELSDHETTDRASEPIDYLNHDLGEDLERLEMGMKKAHAKDEKIASQLKEMQTIFEQEKEKMQKTIHILKKEIEHQAPLANNKFLTISKELSEISTAMNKLVASEDLDSPNAPIIQPNINIPPADKADTTKSDIAQQVKIISGSSLNKSTEEKTAATPSATTNPIPANPSPNTENEKVDTVVPTSTDPIPADSAPKPEPKPVKAKRRLPKPLLIIISTLLITGVVGGLIWYNFNRKPGVSEQLIQQYLPSDAQKPVQTENSQEEKKIEPSPTSQTQNNTNPTQVQGASDSKYEESQADVPYSDTLWDTFKDPTIGVELSYPKNTVNAVKTESSLTFLRKTGYIFKVQIYETALNVEEYWKSVKANNLDYKEKITEFRENPALFLELEEIAEYPGDRYIVKKGDFIYDIWYATYNKMLTDDDIKRVDIMLNSFKFIES